MHPPIIIDVFWLLIAAASATAASSDTELVGQLRERLEYQLAESRAVFVAIKVLALQQCPQFKAAGSYICVPAQPRLNVRWHTDQTGGISI